MLVCHCNKVCDRIIRQCVRSGAESVAAVQGLCNAGVTCGGCLPLVARIVRSEQAQAAEEAAVPSSDLAAETSSGAVSSGA